MFVTICSIPIKYPTHGEYYTTCASSIRPPYRPTGHRDGGLFHSGFPVPHRVQRVGTLGDGGKWVCGLDRVVKQEKCVIYSFGLFLLFVLLFLGFQRGLTWASVYVIGINGESSFESTLLKRAPGCEAWGYDYSVNSWGPEITGDPELRDRAHFKPFDCPSRSAGQTTTKITTTPNTGRSTRSWISTIDIEGGEFDALTAFLGARAAAEGDVLPVGQLQLEIHAREGHENFEYFARWWAALEAAGLRPFWTEPNLVYINLVRGVRPELAEYSFINIRGNHALVNEAFN
ncbi:hypothetical protein EDB83DRAFT_384626 [Lactarius deliciosus]|nr:hypothetical protein EDB83DRAFT_384626 [Lactarius deliciosus]